MRGVEQGDQPGVEDRGIVWRGGPRGRHFSQAFAEEAIPFVDLATLGERGGQLELRLGEIDLVPRPAGKGGDRAAAGVLHLDDSPQPAEEPAFAFECVEPVGFDVGVGDTTLVHLPNRREHHPPALEGVTVLAELLEDLGDPLGTAHSEPQPVLGIGLERPLEKAVADPEEIGTVGVGERWAAGDDPIGGGVGEVPEKVAGQIAAGSDLNVGAPQFEDVVGGAGDGDAAGRDRGEARSRRQRPAPRPFGNALEQGGTPSADRPVGEEAIEIVGEIAGRGVAAEGLALEALLDDRAEIGRHSRHQPAQGFRRPQGRLAEHVGGGRPVEGGRASEHRQERAADGMEIGKRADRAQEGIEAGLLRCHVARCPHHGRGLREPAGGIVGAGKAEVDELRRA